MGGPQPLLREISPPVSASSGGVGGNDGYLTAQQYEALLNGASPGTTLTYSTVAALRAGTVPANATYAVLLGYYAAGDNGGGNFYYDENSVATDDGGLVFKPTSVSGAGRWIRLYNSRGVNPKWFGAVGDGSSHPLSGYFATLAAAQAIYPSAAALTDEIDGVAIQSAINAIKGTPGASANRGGIVQFTGGHYKCNTKLVCDRSLGLTLRGLSGGSVSGVPSSGGVTLEWSGDTVYTNPYYSAPFISAKSSYFFSLLWINIQYTNASYYGHLIELQHYGGATVESGTTSLPNITFSAGTTITRPSGSFITDGWEVGQVVYVQGSASNDAKSGVITELTATTITTAATTWTAETIDFAPSDGLYSSYGDTQLATIRNCSFVQNNGAITAGTGAKALLAMTGAIICSIENCFFGTCETAILFRDFGYGSGVYSNAHVVRNCTFGYHQYSLVSAGQDIVVDGCTFEGLGGFLKGAYYDYHARTTAQIENTFTFDPVAKTVTRTGGSFVTDGWQIGYAAKYGRADGYFGNLGNVTNVTATVLTCDGTFPTGSPFVVAGTPQALYDFDVYNDTVTAAGIESTSQLGNTITITGTSVTRSDGLSFIDDGWTIGETPYGPGGGGLSAITAVTASTLTLTSAPGNATHTSGYYLRGGGGGGPITFIGCWLGDQFRFDDWLKPLGVTGLILNGNFIDSNARVLSNWDQELTGQAAGNVFAVLRPYEGFLFQGTNGITGFKFCGNAGGAVKGQSSVSNANLVMMANKSLVAGEAFQVIDDTYTKQVLRFSGGMLLTKDVYNPFGTDTPHTLLQLAGPIAWKYESSTSNDTLNDEDSFYDISAAGGNRTVTLPTAAGIAGREYTIKRVDNSGNTCGVATTGGQTIDGAASPYALAAQNSTVTVVSDGSNWRIKSFIA